MRKIFIDFLLATKKSFRIVKNFYSTNYSKNALISMNVNNFINNNIGHTNYLESQVIAKILKSLGYNIDVVSFDNDRDLNLEKYDLILGFGLPLEKSFSSRKQITRIYYATGASTCYQNKAEIDRIIEVNQRKKSKLLPKRLIKWMWSNSIAFSDAMILIGNDWTKSTYQGYTTNDIFTINATSLFYKKFISQETNISSRRRHFLWFGSGGLVHKGLDLCLEYFKNHVNFELHICGPKEEDFFYLYQNELNLRNIHYHGFIDVSSQKFIDITQQCLFSIMPTCSEGQSTALLTTMSVGLIPVASIQVGKNISDLGFLISELSIQGIENAIDNLRNQSDNYLYELSLKNIQEIRELHSLESFKNNIEQILINILMTRNNNGSC